MYAVPHHGDTWGFFPRRFTPPYPVEVASVDGDFVIALFISQPVVGYLLFVGWMGVGVGMGVVSVPHALQIKKRTCVAQLHQ